ncbi:MAG: hypothetical protein NCW75_15100 [Phycisphaera sp.]|nr:MAG: hypothetical protein NCW75_15100 [Phycisphaera sp.]
MSDTPDTNPPPIPPEPAAGPRRDPELPARLRAIQVRTGDLVRLRVLFGAIVQLLGMGLVVFSVLPVGWWLIEGIDDGDLWWMEYYWPRLALAAYMVLVGGGMVLFGGLLGRVLVRSRVGPVACPMCKFELTSLDRGRCTECGYEANPALPELGVPPIERVLVARLAAFVLTRVVAVGIVTLALIPMMRFVLVDVREGYSGSVEFVGALLPTMAIAVLGLTLWLLAGPLSAIMVPMKWARKLAAARADDQ